MSEDDVLVRGEEVDPADLIGDVEVEQNGYATLGRGLAYAGLALVLSGPLMVVPELPSDLSTVSAATFQPAVGNMAIGIVFIGVASLVTIVTSGPVTRSISWLIERWQQFSEPEPLDTEPVGQSRGRVESSSDDGSDETRSDPLAQAGDVDE